MSIVFRNRGFDHPASKHLVCSVCGGIHYAKGFCRFHYSHPSRDINTKYFRPNKIKAIGNNHGPIFINRAKKILPFCCDNCKSKKNVYLHHKDGNTYNNPKDASNWQFLCSTCHTIVHIYGKFPTLEEMNKIKNERIASSQYRTRLKIRAKTLKRNIPDGYITTKEVEKILKLSRERIRQIKNKMIYMETNHMHDPSRRPVRFWLKSSVLDYALDPAQRIGVQRSTLQTYLTNPMLIQNQKAKEKIDNYFLQGYPKGRFYRQQIGLKK